MLIKSFVLLLVAIYPNPDGTIGTYYAPASYYDTMKECEERKVKIISSDNYNFFRVKASCFKTIQEVEGN